MKTKHIYLFLALLGVCYTWYYNIEFYQTVDDTSITNFIAQTTTTFPAQSIVADLTVVVIVFFIWMFAEARRIKVKYWWVLIPLTFLIAIACTFPLFLYMREVRLEKIVTS